MKQAIFIMATTCFLLLGKHTHAMATPQNGQADRVISENSMLHFFVQFEMLIVAVVFIRLCILFVRSRKVIDLKEEILLS